MTLSGIILSEDVSRAQSASQPDPVPNGPMEGREFGGRPTMRPFRHDQRGRERLIQEVDRIDTLGHLLNMNAEQARHYALLKAQAEKIIADLHPPGSDDPFQTAGRSRSDMAGMKVDRDAFAAEGSALFATLDERQKALLKTEWRETFEPFLRAGAHGGPRMERREDDRDRAPYDAGGGSPPYGTPSPPNGRF